MKIAIGGDHAGFHLKQELAAWLREQGHEVEDLGTHSTESCDYPDYARAVGGQVAAGAAERGILICGSGVGTCIAANKVKGVRAAVCHDTFSARQGVEDDDMNTICLGARVIGFELAREIVSVFLKARFSNAERHQRRLRKVLDIESRGK
ncbi:MAG: ribose 5-phosphate isomerase B [bacterium]|nr:ribose 5-phosphate isomerase B [bacterium]